MAAAKLSRLPVPELSRFVFHQLQEQEFTWLEFRILGAIGDREQRLLDTLVNLG